MDVGREREGSVYEGRGEGGREGGRKARWMVGKREGVSLSRGSVYEGREGGRERGMA